MPRAFIKTSSEISVLVAGVVQRILPALTKGSERADRQQLRSERRRRGTHRGGAQKQLLSALTYCNAGQYRFGKEIDGISDYSRQGAEVTVKPS